MSESSVADDRSDIAELAHAYADALDRRDWSALDDVFTHDVRADYNGVHVLRGRTDLVAMIRTYLDGCGPTQHLMGNHRISLDGDRARLSVKMRVHHIGAGVRADLTYECFGWYHADAIRTPHGWRFRGWRQEVVAELGTHEVFVLV